MHIQDVLLPQLGGDCCFHRFCGSLKSLEKGCERTGKQGVVEENVGRHVNQQKDAGNVLSLDRCR